MLSPRRLAAIAVVAVLVAAAPALAYTVILKDGSQLVAKQKYRVAGDRAILTLPNGTRTSLPLAQIDVERTEAANLVDYGDAVVLDGPNQQAEGAPPQAAQPSLSDVAGRGGPRLAPRREAAAAAAAPTGNAPMTAAGSIDLLRMQRNPLGDLDLGSRLGQLLRDRGVSDVALYQGSTGGRVLLEFTTNSEAAVFRAVQASAEALVELADSGAAPEAIELFMATDRRQRAGQFVMTLEMARELTTRQLDVSEFYVTYVQW